MNEEQKRIEELISIDKKTILEQRNRIEQLEQDNNKLFRSLINDILLLIDSHDDALAIVKENKWDKSEFGNSIIMRYARIKNKATNLLAKRGVEKITFPDNKLLLDCCKTVDTEPDSTQVNGTIISIEKEGYKKGSEVIRDAEVIIVKN